MITNDNTFTIALQGGLGESIIWNCMWLCIYEKK